MRNASFTLSLLTLSLLTLSLLALSLLTLVTLVGKLQSCGCTALEVTNVVENSATPALRIFLAKNIQRHEKHSIGPGNGTEWP